MSHDPIAQPDSSRGALMTEPNFSLSGKIAVVTGASRGIGKSIAGALAGAGATVVLMARDEATLGEAHRELIAEGYTVSSLCLDIGIASDIDAAFGKVKSSLGRIDILVNNAGIEQVCPSLEVDEALWDRIIGINLKGAFFCAQAAARRMEQGGAIVNMCSLTSEVGVPQAVPYGASKSGLAGLTRALAAEWAQKGIRVNGIGPGYFRTALTETFYRDEQWQTRMLEKIPLRRFGNLDDLKGAAVFLCSDAAAYITGQILYVDGGYLASI
jgi:NAD(P)-dependent dehydrogenase (short-subunit alcohol dehydrogenase family)